MTIDSLGVLQFVSEPLLEEIFSYIEDPLRYSSVSRSWKVLCLSLVNSRWKAKLERIARVFVHQEALYVLHAMGIDIAVLMKEDDGDIKKYISIILSGELSFLQHPDELRALLEKKRSDVIRDFAVFEKEEILVAKMSEMSLCPEKTVTKVSVFYGNMSDTVNFLPIATVRSVHSEVYLRDISLVPVSLCHFRGLRILRLENVNIERVPKFLKRLSIDTLEISGCSYLQNIPSWIGESETLTTLILWNLPCEKLPALSEKSILERVDIIACPQCQNIPDTYFGGRKVRELTVGGVPVGDLSRISICSLRVLRLAHCLNIIGLRELLERTVCLQTYCVQSCPPFPDEDTEVF